MTRGFFTGLVIPLALALAPPANAQSTVRDADAEALFTDAKALRDAGKYPEACAKFADSDRLAPGVGVALYLGDCYEHVGKTASAWVSFRNAEKRARARKDERGETAAARAKALEPKLGRVTFAVARSLRRPGVEVWLDGRGPVSPDSYGLGVAADPGAHTVALKFAGRVVRAADAYVAPGSAAQVRLDEPPLPPRPPRDESAALAPTPAHESRMPPRLAVGIALLGIGAAGVATGAVFLAAKNQSMSDGSPEGTPSVERGTSIASAAGFAVGGAALASAIVLYLTAPKPKEGAILLAPAPLLTGGGASLRVTF